uniref:Heterotrimeric G protein gamma subunit n=1 Tax=Chara braunii TaxID=69332 RepID=V5SNJ0_CHABU|nr:heterotrimeric G protein gamma subunit [Chara braunii]
MVDGSRTPAWAGRGPMPGTTNFALAAPLPPAQVPEVRGKAKKRAELRKLEREIELLQEELKALNERPPVAQACEQLVGFVENCRDPFLNGARNRWVTSPSEVKCCPPFC